MKKENFNCGVILLSGFPNAGKSTLLNCILKEKISIVSHKVQTTKDKISGVINVNNTQLIFTDTPGITKNNKFFDKKISRSLLNMEEIVDFNLFVFDTTNSVKKETLGQIVKIVKSFNNNYLVLNKVDLVRKEHLLNSSQIINSEIKFLKTFMISAKKNRGIEYLVKNLVENAPSRPWKYSKNVTTDKSMNFRISEITREKIFQLINKEIPYSIKINSKIDRSKKIIKVYQEIFVTKDSQKSIIIGKNAEKIKMIGTRARDDIEKLLKRKVYLDLIVKKRRN